MQTNEVELKILNAAQKEFELKGFDGARMQSIADSANMSKASLHYYFRSKEKIFERIFELALQELIPIFNSLMEIDLHWEKQIEQFTQGLIQYIENGRMLFLIREINRDPEILDQFHKNKKNKHSVVTYLEKLQTEGKISTVFNAKILYMLLNSMCCFPSINRKMFEKSLRVNKKEFDELMIDYGKIVAHFFISAVKINEQKNGK